MSFVKASSDARGPHPRVDESHLRIEESVKVSEKLKTDLMAALQDEFGRAAFRLNVASHFAKQEGPWDPIRGPIEVDLRFKQPLIPPEPDKGRG